MKQNSDSLLLQVIFWAAKSVPPETLCIVMCIPELTQVKAVNPPIAGELSNPVRVKEKE